MDKMIADAIVELVDKLADGNGHPATCYPI